MGIYKITNISNGRVYIGSTNNFSKRKRTHLEKLRIRKHSNPFLQADFNKCGEENFVFEVVLETDCKDLLLFFEQSYIDEFYDNQISCYNIEKIASCPPSWKNKKHSEETKAKMSKNHKRPLLGKKFSEETKAKMSKSQLGRIHSIETRNKISRSKKGIPGKKPSEETKRKIGLKSKGRKLSQEHCQKISNALKGTKHTQEFKDKLRKANLDKKHSDETKKRMSESHKKRLALN